MNHEEHERHKVESLYGLPLAAADGCVMSLCLASDSSGPNQPE